MARKVTRHNPYTEILVVVGLCVLSFVFGSLMTFFLHPSLREIDQKKAQCYMIYGGAATSGCAVRIVVEPNYQYHQYQ